MRFIAILLTATLVSNFGLSAAPASAMTTAKEVAIGAGQNQQIDDENVVITDPFLTNWVTGVGAKLAANRYRTDINYRFEILDTADINAFALPGGFMHANLGLLNFIGSDDELAAVLGHEMGHVERRHVITLNTKASILGVLIGILSVLTPIAYLFGGYGGDLALYKFSRIDELQADQYGLLLMSRAGYDPQSNVDLMAHLGKLERGGPQQSRSDQWMESHPPPKDRIAHLEGYPELNNPSASEIIAVAIHDQDEGRYTYARARFETALHKSPGNALALSHLSELNLALKEPAASAAGSTRTVAGTSALDVPSIPDLATELARAQAITKEDQRLAGERARGSRNDLETLITALSGQSNAVPNLGSPKKKDNNLAKAIQGLNRLTRDINNTLGLSDDVLGNAADLTSQNLEPLKAMADALAASTPSAKTEALLPYYPQLSASLSASSDQILSGVDDARAAISMGSDSVKLLGTFLSAMNAIDTTSGDISAKDMPKIQAALDTALSAWDAAEAMAQHASDLMYAGQTTTLSTNITLLDLFSSKDRYDAYARAVGYRFPGVALPDYDTVERLGTLPGELGCDAWISYETKQSVLQLMRQEQTGGLSCADIAVDQHLFGESMEIAEGLLYEDYIEVPETAASIAGLKGGAGL